MRKFVILSALLALNSCGISVTDRSKAGATKDTDSPFTVVQILPASGSVAALPSTITISFSEVPHRGMLSAQTHYNINCGAETLHVTAVDATTGYSSVTVTLPAITGIGAGSSCTFAVSPNLLDQSGNRLGGARTVTYVLTQ